MCIYVYLYIQIYKYMTRNPSLKLTTVLIVEDFKDPLAVDNIKTKMSLQKIVNRCLHLYLNDVKLRLFV